jgi:hypothetical protein
VIEHAVTFAHDLEDAQRFAEHCRHRDRAARAPFGVPVTPRRICWFTVNVRATMS